MVSKIIPIDKNIIENLKILSFSNKRILVLSFYNKYISIPNKINLKKINDTLILFSTDKNISQKSIDLFSNFILKSLINYKKYFKKTIFLKGLGLKVFLFKNRKRLKLKLGFSHLIKIFIPEKIKMFRNKKRTAISLASEDSVFLGNFSKIIKNFKMPNTYTGKGFSYKRELLTLKSFKKK